MAQPKNGLMLETKVEVIRVQLDNLLTSFNEFREENRRWRDEMKADLANRVEKHESLDEHRHGTIEGQVKRLEDETLEAGKMMVARIEKVEQSDVASKAVSADRKWIIGLALTTAITVLVQVFTLIKPYLLAK